MSIFKSQSQSHSVPFRSIFYIPYLTFHHNTVTRRDATRNTFMCARVRRKGIHPIWNEWGLERTVLRGKVRYFRLSISSNLYRIQSSVLDWIFFGYRIAIGTVARTESAYIHCM